MGPRMACWNSSLQGASASSRGIIFALRGNNPSHPKGRLTGQLHWFGATHTCAFLNCRAKGPRQREVVVVRMRVVSERARGVRTAHSLHIGIVKIRLLKVAVVQFAESELC
eukprot:399270-Pyramimonas_sp.AAC.1